MARKIRIGCSGWNYKDWRERFYPARLPAQQWLRHYAAHFDTVEINNSFYRLPTEAAVRQWAGSVPGRFVFAVKVSRFLTHMKKLTDTEQGLRLFLERIAPLGKHLGPLLYQLPPHWRCNLERLQRFIEALPPQLTHVFEFREPSWINDEIFTLLEKHRASLCVHDMSGIEVPKIAIGRVAYVRFHGSEAKYRGGYPRAALARWAEWLHAQARRRPAFAYFNNDVAGHAVQDARVLIEEVGRW